MRGRSELIPRWSVVLPAVAMVIFLGSKPLEIPSRTRVLKRQPEVEAVETVNGDLRTIVREARKDRKNAIDRLTKLRLEIADELEKHEAMIIAKELPQIALERAQAFREMVEQRLGWLEEQIAAGGLEEANDSVLVWTRAREPVPLGAKQPGIRIMESQELRPEMSPRIRPAHGGVEGEPSFNPPVPGRSDTSETLEIQFTEILEELAATLDYDVRKILEYVQGTIRYEPYKGSMKGAEETYVTGSGNDVDQASLLMALLRVSGIPCRYVEGVIRLETERVLSWLGVQIPVAAARAFGFGGIPYQTIMGDGPSGISHFDIDHVWVEAYLPMQNYRGAPGDDRGKIWVPFAPAIKTLEASGSVNIVEEMKAFGNPFEAEGFFDAYIESLEARSPMDAFHDSMVSYLADAHPGMSIENAKRTRVIKGTSYPILPLTLPAKILVVRGEYDECPENWWYRVEVKAYSGSDTLLTANLPLPQIGTRRVVMGFKPETEEDALTLVAYGGVYNVPAYLVRVTPVVRVAGETVGQGSGGMGLGCPYWVRWRVTGPKGELVDREMEKTAGMQWGVGLVSGQVPGTLHRSRRGANDGESVQGRELHEVVMRYWEGAWDGYRRFGELWWTWLLHEPDVIVSSTQLAVDEVLGQPVGVWWQGLYINVRLAIGIVELDAVVSDRDRVARGAAFVATGTASWVEHGVFEEKYKASAISAVKALERGVEQGAGVYDIDGENLEAQLAIIDLPVWAENQIRNYVSAGYNAKVPGDQVTQDDWTGVGYVFWKDQGCACYLLQGARGGGETTEPFIWGGWNDFWVYCVGGWQEYYPDVGEDSDASIPCDLCSTRVEWIWPPDSSVWAWGESIGVARYDTLFWEGEDPETLGPDTCWFYSDDYDPNIYTLKAEIFGPYPPGSQNDPIWYFGGDSLRFWTVKVEVDENLSDRILDVPVAEGDSTEVPVQTMFRVLPDSASVGVSFLHSPVGQDTTKVEFHHYVTRPAGETGVDTVRSMKKFNVHCIETVGTVDDDNWKYVLEWEQKNDEGEWFEIDEDIDDRPYQSHVMMNWVDETRAGGMSDSHYEAKPAGLDLVVFLTDGSGLRDDELPESEEQGEGKGLYIQLNDNNDAGQECPDCEFFGPLDEPDPQLIHLGLRIPEYLPQGMEVHFSMTGSDVTAVRIWKDPLKGIEHLLNPQPLEDDFFLLKWDDFMSPELREIVENGLWLEACNLDPGVQDPGVLVSLLFVDPAHGDIKIEDLIEQHTARLRVVNIDARVPDVTQANFELSSGPVPGTGVTLENAKFYFPGEEPEELGNVSGTFPVFYDQSDLYPGQHNIVVEGWVHETYFRCGYVAVRTSLRAPESEWQTVSYPGWAFVEECLFYPCVTFQLAEWFHNVEYYKRTTYHPVSLIAGSKCLWVGDSICRVIVDHDLPGAISGDGWAERHLYRDACGDHADTIMTSTEDSWENDDQQIELASAELFLRRDTSAHARAICEAIVMTTDPGHYPILFETEPLVWVMLEE